MSLNLFYITNRPEVALIAEKYGVNRIWIDLETLGKAERQPGCTVKSNHSISDIRKIKPLLTSSELLVRINPWHENSPREIEDVLAAGADLVMLPMWKTASEAKAFLDCVGKRAKTVLLLETREAVACVDEILALRPDEIYVGLNDLHLSYGLTFMFELLSNGVVENLCEKFKKAGIPYGFGGIARLGGGLVRSEKVIMEHYRLGSSRAILSRSFCDVFKCEDMNTVDKLFRDHLPLIREYEATCAKASPEIFEKNRQELCRDIEQIVRRIKESER